jgi:hypothetical protein
LKIILPRNGSRGISGGSMDQEEFLGGAFVGLK